MGNCYAVYAMFKRDRDLLRPEAGSTDIPVPYKLVAWVNMSDFDFWGNDIPKFYGIVCRHPKQRNFALATRGTAGVVECFDDAMAFLVLEEGIQTRGLLVANEGKSKLRRGATIT